MLKNGGWRSKTKEKRGKERKSHRLVRNVDRITRRSSKKVFSQMHCTAICWENLKTSLFLVGKKFAACRSLPLRKKVKGDTYGSSLYHEKETVIITCKARMYDTINAGNVQCRSLQEILRIESMVFISTHTHKKSNCDNGVATMLIGFVSTY